jgi:TPR repeat protein
VTKRKASRGHWLRMTGQAPPRPSASKRIRHAAAPTPVDRVINPSVWRWTATTVGLAGIAVTMFFLGGQLGTYMSRPTAQPAMARAVFSTSSAEAATPRARVFAGEENLATLAELERYSWQEVARRVGERLGADGGAALSAEAAAGNPAAKVELCVAHLRGIEGFTRDAAREPCLASAAQNHPAGQFLVWVARDRVGVAHDEARDQLVAAADQGWAPAQQLLASYYRNAREGFARDPTRARTLLTAAAAKGYPRAMLDLSVMYLRAGDVEERALARTYLRRVMADREFPELCRPARQGLVSLGEAPAACRRT